jgi:hypothetical protein
MIQHCLERDPGDFCACTLVRSMGVKMRVKEKPRQGRGSRGGGGQTTLTMDILPDLQGSVCDPFHTPPGWTSPGALKAWKCMTGAAGQSLK